MTDEEEGLRHRLAERLARSGHLRTTPWREAVETVPRHEFLRGGFFEAAQGSMPTAWRPVMPDDPRWLSRCYDDDSLVTQIAGTIGPRDIRGEIMRSPTSSSTMPGLVVRMLEDLQVDDEQHVLEIGTGTGYSTSLLCHRLGDELVTSIEVDETVAIQARNSLGHVGYTPSLVVGDGLAGHKEGGPYDRLIATCGVLTLPTEWITQVRPGGLILATVCGWMYSSELARLTVNDDGTATGTFLGGQISFMLARRQQPPLLGLLPDLDDGDERRTPVGPGLDDWNTRFVAQLAAPHAQKIGLTRDDGRTEQILIDVDAGAWAALYQDTPGGQWMVRQGGPERLWDAVENDVQRWQADGAPPLERFTITVGPSGQHITWPKA
ncbi:SAM-dependent methyltransferase [Streptomyces spectabilis]|uniref:Protein-L-isoaspartate O-methyltransferase n=1 Tax=Streptomyces spectabilis TaxID=68270 RepID=A0A7W8F0D2_STRST|nr:ATP-grasp peptide maturase system methyltransferase [Streptomyces spectabilis]MBB5110099.1 methyltransferase of ATP-grasp peptide maturase system [Streptomyces spectabilis]GGV58488.1 SAM-dependent methyltransferase [Streptomyces spectabilis]